MTTAIAVACGDDLPPITWEGERVRFGTTADHLPCGETLETLDRKVAEYEIELAEPLAEGKKITYYWLPGEMDRSPCHEAPGCASKRKVYAQTPLLYHEIVHALLLQQGLSHAVLMEGFAEAFTGEALVTFLTPDESEVEITASLQQGVKSEDVNYDLAGIFVRHLVETYGFIPVKRVYVRASYSATMTDFATIFPEELGVSFEEALALFGEQAQPCLPELEPCPGEPVPWDDDITWHHQFDMRCDIDDLVEEYLGALSRSVLIDIPHEGPYLVEPSRSSGSAASLVILGCEADDECTRESYGFHMGDQEVTGFVPGRYEVVVTERSGSVKEVDSSVEVVITAL